MSLPTNGGTDRDDFGSVAALSAHPFSTLSQPPPPSYSISRSQIVANRLSRKRSHSGDPHSSASVGESPPRVAFTAPQVAFASPSTYLGGTSTTVLTTGASRDVAAALPSIRCQAQAQPSAKRLRQDPLSPTSVGEVSDAKKMPPARTVASTPGPAQMQSMLRGLQHISTCSANGCSNPLCVSTRTFVDKVNTHRTSMAGKVNHDANRCGACKLWGKIVRVHATTCSATLACRIPGCSLQQ
ncbi:hypothetical protein V7S43_005420 [Phytophthora oleae]|uniref:TAZ-type domain-containing protein n=1 Tax=Phytophthora oleae TaxID=2107226 RepID=A0ABD3FSZ1_9STRA